MGNYVETNGIKLHYLERPGDGPTLLLAPGLAAGAHFYLTLMDRLAPRLHVIAFDLRGRGASDKPDTGYTMADHAADMVGAMDALGIDRVAFGGHSFGGLLTYILAAYYPERIERGVVIDAPAEVGLEVGIHTQIVLHVGTAVADGQAGSATVRWVGG